MTANATHPGRVTIPGSDIGVGGTLVAEPQVEHMLLSLDDRLALGPVKVDTDPTGTLEAPGLVVPIVSGVLWLLRFEPKNNAIGDFDLGVYNLNTSGVPLDDLVETEPTTISETDRLNIAAAVALGATNDTATAGFVNTSGTATRGALDARYNRVRSFDLRNYGFDTAATDAARRTAFAAAVADACAATYPSEVYVPAGSWTMSLDGSSRWATLTKGIRIRGAGRNKTILKVSNTAGNFVALLDATNGTTDLSDMELCDLTVDYNTANRPANTAAMPDGGSRRVLNVPMGDEVYVHHCRFLNVDAMQVLMLSGASGLSNVRVHENDFVLDAGTLYWHDHSAIYAHSQGISIKDNTFEGNNSLGARACIETHGHQVDVSRNVAYNYSAFGNLTGIYNPAGALINWHDNIGIGLGRGIVLWCQVYSGSVAPGLRDVDIHDNTFLLDVDAWPLALTNAGTGFLLSRGSDLPAKNVRIHHNTVRVKPFTGTALDTSYNHSCGISWGRTVGTGIFDEDLYFEDNYFEGTVGPGVEINAGTVTNGSVSRNTIINPGRGVTAGGFSATYTCGILLSGVTLRRFRVNGNSIRDDAGTALMQRPIDLSTMSAGSGEIEAVGNRHYYAAGTVLSPIKSSTTSGLGVFADYVTTAYSLPLGNYEAGSRVMDTTTGIERRQDDVLGTNWRRSKSPGTAPTVAPQTAAGVGATATIVAGGNDKAGIVNITPAGTPATGAQVIVTFANAFAVAPRAVVLTAASVGASGRSLSATNITTGGFTINFSTVGVAGTLYQVQYVVEA